MTEEVRREGHERAIDSFKSQIQDKPIEADLEHIRAELEIFHHACECENYEQAYSIYCEIDDLIGLRGFHKEIVQLLEMLIDRWTKQEDNLLKISQCYRYLGNAYDSLGDYPKAIDFHSQSMEIKEAIGNKAGVARSLFNLSNIYQQRGRLKLSMHYRHQAYRIWQDMNLPLVAAPFPTWTKNLIQSMGDTWAEQLIAAEKSMTWLNFLLGYLVFTLLSTHIPSEKT